MNFKLACDRNGVCKGAAMWLFHSFMRKTASAVLNARLSDEDIVAKNRLYASGKSSYYTPCQ